jgi:hypothetical protein
VELFCDRAAAADQRFDPTVDDRALIGRICTRLDGMPLAIELAASRTRSMTLAQLEDRLADRFRLLHSSARGGAAERHRTLRAVVDWSYRLLTPQERVLFDRLSVFAGSFDADAAEAVCGQSPLKSLGVFDLLGSLVDKSLVLVDRDTGRYRLLETLRQYGVEQLEARGEADTPRTRHLAHVLEVVEEARRLLHGEAYVRGASVFDTEWDNLRAAVGWATELGDAATASTLVVAPFWYATWFLRFELGVWADKVRSLPGAGPATHGGAGYFSFTVGDVAGARRCAEDGIRASPSPTDPETVLCWLGMISCDAALGRSDQVRDNITMYAAAAASIDDAYAAAIEFILIDLLVADPEEAARYVEVATSWSTSSQWPQSSGL